MSPEQKVVAITGASQGIGERLMKGYRDIGYGVVVNARSIKKISASNDPAVVAVEGDIADAATGGRIVTAALDRFGRLDTLINNAGIFIAKPFIDYSEVDFAMMTAVNLAGFFHVSRKAASWMLNKGSGHIVNITATIAEQPMASLPAALAALTKGGLNAVTRSLAIEYATRGVRVNAVAPGVVTTPMHAPRHTRFSPRCNPWDGWARRRTSPTPSSISKRRHSSPARSFTSTAARPQGFGEVAMSGMHWPDSNQPRRLAINPAESLRRISETDSLVVAAVLTFFLRNSAAAEVPQELGIQQERGYLAR